MVNKSYSFLEKCYLDNFQENKDTLFETKETIFNSFLKDKNDPNLSFKYIYKNNDAVGYYVINKNVEEKLKPFVDYLIIDFYVIPAERRRGFASNCFKNILSTGNISLGFVLEDESIKGKKIVDKLSKELHIKVQKSSGQYPDKASTKLYVINGKTKESKEIKEGF